VLLRTREKVERLEARIAELEGSTPATMYAAAASPANQPGAATPPMGE
jgi:BMFP domain-containing protein YqiC